MFAERVEQGRGTAHKLSENSNPEVCTQRRTYQMREDHGLRAASLSRCPEQIQVLVGDGSEELADSKRRQVLRGSPCNT